MQPKSKIVSPFRHHISRLRLSTKLQVWGEKSRWEAVFSVPALEKYLRSLFEVYLIDPRIPADPRDRGSSTCSTVTLL